MVATTGLTDLVREDFGLVSSSDVIFDFEAINYAMDVLHYYITS